MRGWFATLLAAVLGTVPIGSAAAENYPTRPAGIQFQGVGRHWQHQDLRGHRQGPLSVLAEHSGSKAAGRDWAPCG